MADLIRCIEAAIAEGEGALMDNYLAHQLDKAGLEVRRRKLPEEIARLAKR
jgi:hypothetical protein